MCKAEAHRARSNLELVHNIVAGEQARLCGADCTHIAAGMTPEQCKEFLNNITWVMANGCGPPGGYESDHYSYDSARTLFVTLLTSEKVTQHFAAKPPASKAGSEDKGP
jgi:hypothetical protein